MCGSSNDTLSLATKALESQRFTPNFPSEETATQPHQAPRESATLIEIGAKTKGLILTRCGFKKYL